MNFDLSTALRFLQSVGPVVAQLPAVKQVFDTAVSTLHETDQATAQAGYADLIGDNDDGHRRLQEKLRTAEGR
jgi:hypothetical protein